MHVGTGIRMLQQPDPLFLDLVDFKQNMRGDVYHPSSFIVRRGVPDGVLLFNTLTCELVLVGKELQELLENEYMREHLFVVPEGLDEKKLVRQYRTLRAMMDDREETVSSYTILTTTDCNARCFYCYEMGRSRIPMSKETAMKVVDMIERNWTARCSKKGDVKLNWFGGEPLYNSEVIDLICSELKHRNIHFHSSMTSNGYLFDKELARKAARMWKLQRIQITLDGTEEVYNRSKAYIYKDGMSPFQRVVRNIGLLLDAGVKVSARLNLGPYNADDLFALVRFLADSFGGKKRFSCYAHPLFEASAGNNSLKLSDDARRLVGEKMKQLDDLMTELGIMSGESKLPKEVKRRWCMADGGNGVIIAPTGEIGLCEHYSESNFFSSVDTPEVVDETVVTSFREHRDEFELCDKCPLYPQCIRLKMCEEAAICYPEKVEYLVNRMQLAMEQKYRKK